MSTILWRRDKGRWTADENTSAWIWRIGVSTIDEMKKHQNLGPLYRVDCDALRKFAQPLPAGVFSRELVLKIDVPVTPEQQGLARTNIIYHPCQSISPKAASSPIVPGHSPKCAKSIFSLTPVTSCCTEAGRGSPISFWFLVPPRLSRLMPLFNVRVAFPALPTGRQASQRRPIIWPGESPHALCRSSTARGRRRDRASATSLQRIPPERVCHARCFEQPDGNAVSSAFPLSLSGGLFLVPSLRE